MCLLRGLCPLPGRKLSDRVVRHAPGGQVLAGVMYLKLQDIIRAFIEEQYPYPGKQITEQDDLFVTGVLDSISFTGLLIFLRKRFALTFDPSELTLENFASIAVISERVEGKLRRREQK